MGVFHLEDPPNPSRRCKFLAATLKDAFANCHTCARGIPASSPEQEHPTSDIEDEQEVVVSEIRSRAMEKLRHKPLVITDSFSSFSWVFSPKTGELFVTPKAIEQEEEDDQEDYDDGDDKREEFFSVGSCFSFCSTALSKEAFLSVKTNFSRCSSFNWFEFEDVDFRRRSIIQELRHCQGWPFGLCRKAVLLPPLPKSPSESWSWRKGTRMVKMP